MADPESGGADSGSAPGPENRKDETLVLGRWSALVLRCPLVIFVLLMGAVVATAAYFAWILQHDVVVEPAVYDRSNVYVSRRDAFRLALQGEAASRHCAGSTVQSTSIEERRLYGVGVPSDVAALLLVPMQSVFFRKDYELDVPDDPDPNATTTAQSQSRYIGVEGDRAQLQLANRSALTRLQIIQSQGLDSISSGAIIFLRSLYKLKYLTVAGGELVLQESQVGVGFTIEHASGDMSPIRGNTVVTLTHADGAKVYRTENGELKATQDASSVSPGALNFVIESDRLERSEIVSTLQLVWHSAASSGDLLRDSNILEMAKAELDLWNEQNVTQDGGENDRCQLIYDHPDNHAPTLSRCKAPVSFLNFLIRDTPVQESLFQEGFSTCVRPTYAEALACDSELNGTCSVAYPQTWSRVECMSPAYSGASIGADDLAGLQSGATRLRILQDVGQLTEVPASHRLQAKRFRDAILPASWEAPAVNVFRSFITYGATPGVTDPGFTTWAKGSLLPKLQRLQNEVWQRTNGNVQLLYADEGNGRPLFRDALIHELFDGFEGWMAVASAFGGAFAWIAYSWGSFYLAVISTLITASSTLIVLGVCKLFFGSSYVSVPQLLTFAVTLAYGAPHMYLIKQNLDRSEFQPHLQSDTREARFSWAVQKSGYQIFVSVGCTLSFLALLMVCRMPALQVAGFTAVAAIALNAFLVLLLWYSAVLLKKSYLNPVIKCMWYIAKCQCICGRKKDDSMMRDDSSLRVSDFQFIRSRRIGRILFNRYHLFDTFSGCFLCVWFIAVVLCLAPLGADIGGIFVAPPASAPDRLIRNAGITMVGILEDEIRTFSTPSSQVNIVLGLSDSAAIDRSTVSRQEIDEDCMGVPQYSTSIVWDLALQTELRALCEALATKTSASDVFCLPEQLHRFLVDQDRDNESVMYLEEVQSPDFAAFQADESADESLFPTPSDVVNFDTGTGFRIADDGTLKLLWVSATDTTPDTQEWDDFLTGFKNNNTAGDRAYVVASEDPRWAWQSAELSLIQLQNCLFYSPLLLFFLMFFATANCVLGLTSALTQLVSVIVISRIGILGRNRFMGTEASFEIGVASMLGLYHAVAVSVYYNAQLGIKFWASRYTGREEKVREALSETGNDMTLNGMMVGIIGVGLMFHRSEFAHAFGTMLSAGSGLTWLIVITFNRSLLSKWGPVRNFGDFYICDRQRVKKKLKVPEVRIEMRHHRGGIGEFSHHRKLFAEEMDGF